MNSIKRLIRRSFRSIGLDLRRDAIHNSPDAWVERLLTAHGVNLVLDVGANTGQYAHSLRDAGYHGKIVSFEPLSSAHAELMSQARRDPLWEIAPRVALGGIDGEVEINIAANAFSSSILPMLQSHLGAAPESAYVGKEPARLARLDAIADGLCLDDSVIFLKIDAQGYEHEVLAGATGVLNIVTGLQLELSLVPLYEGQKSYVEMLGLVLKMGFELEAIIPGLMNSNNGRLLQVDALFFKP